MRKAPLIVIAIFVALCALGGFGLKAFQSRSAASAPKETVTVERGDLEVMVVDSGTLDAVKVVELKSRASGRLQELLVQEGDRVQRGDLLAIIDPQETQFKVEQDSAQLRGAQSGVKRQQIEVEQRRVTSAAALKQAQARVAQLELEAQAQPALTSAAAAQAGAALRSAKAERNRLVQTAHPSSRVAAENSLREAQANFDNARSDEARQRELLAKGYVAQRVVENAALALRVAESRLQTARDALESLGALQRVELEKAEEEIRRAQAEVDRTGANRIQDDVKRKELETARAEVSRARAALRDVEALLAGKRQSEAGVSQLRSVLSDSRRQLSETRITSPISGVVTKQLIQEGELVAALSGFSAGTSIVRIEDRTSMLVKLNVNEIDVAKLKRGMSAEVTVDAFPNKTFRGTVTKIAPASNNLTSTAPSADAVVKYEVEISLANPSEDLRSGMSAKCSLVVASRKHALRVPIAYLGKDERGSYLMIAPAEPNGKPTRKDVAVGLTTGAYAEILSGVPAGAKLRKPDYSGPERMGMMSAGPEEE